MSSSASQISQLLSRGPHSSERVYEQVIACAMNRLVQLSRQMLHGYPRMRRWEETDDVFQEAAIRLVKSLREVQPTTTAEFFGLAVLQIRRTLIDMSRRHFGPLGAPGRQQSDPLLFTHDYKKHHPADVSDEPQSLAEWTEFHESVDSLPKDELEVFGAVFYGGATYAETAALLGVTRRTAIRRMNRARLRLVCFFNDDVPIPTVK